MRGLIVSLAALAAAAPVAADAAPVLLDFNSASQAWIRNSFLNIDTPYLEEGYVVRTAGGPFDVLGIGDHTWCSPAPCATNGTQALRSGFAGTVTLIEREDLGEFNFLGFDAAELVSNFASTWAEGIRVTGYKADLTSITQDFLLDAAADGPGGVTDFQSFTSNGLFTGLVKLTFEGFGTTGAHFSADNIALSVGEVVPVPEPAGIALLAMGLPALVFLRRRSRR